MKIARTPKEARRILEKLRSKGDRIGFVPTMGDLHEGHLSLIRLSMMEMDRTVVSIFVNPTQFGPNEDFNRYPRDHQRDQKILKDIGCDLLFIPATRNIYSADGRTRVSVKGVTDYLCGSYRPGHFNGVTLVVAKLFNIISPDTAFFGQKDAQQAVVIQRMAADLDFPVKIRLGPVVREESGLAKSSRNRYLGEEDREKAVSIFSALNEAFSLIRKGERDSLKIRDIVKRKISESGLEVQYAEVVRGKDMKPVDEIRGVVLISVAAMISGVRLIDNIAVRVQDGLVEEVLLEFPEWSRYD